MGDGGVSEDGLVHTRAQQMAGIEVRVDGVEVKKLSHLLVHRLEHGIAYCLRDGGFVRSKWRRAGMTCLRHVCDHTAVDLGPRAGPGAGGDGCHCR